MNRTRKKKKGEENRVCFSHYGTVLSIPDSGWFEIPRVRKTERKVQLLRVQKPMWKNGRLRHQCVFEIVGEKGNQEERKLFCQSGDFFVEEKPKPGNDTISPFHSRRNSLCAENCASHQRNGFAEQKKVDENRSNTYKLSHLPPRGLPPKHTTPSFVSTVSCM